MNPNHPVTISVFDDSRHGHGQGVPTTWAALVKRLAEHREGEKDGSNFVPARFHPEPAKQGGGVRRTKARLVARTAVALDIEMNKGTGEIPLAFADAVAAVQRRGWAGVLYTSFNHTAELPRYRIVLPITSEVGHDLPAPEVVAEELGLTGVLDATKLGAASVFYAPRTTPDARAKHRAEEVSGEPIDADWLATKAGELKARQDAAKAELKRQHQEEARQRREARNAAGIDPGWSLIAQVRAHLDLREELIGHGYEPRENGRYLFPGSDTGVAGVQILDGDDGVQRAYSHHANDPLAPGNLPTGYAKALDVVDVIAVLDHGGDQKKALHTLAQRFGISEPRASAQDEFTAREPAGKNGKPGLLTLDDLEAQPDPTWLVDKLIPERSFGIVGGPAKSGKTFLALSAGAHIAAGLPWFGHDVKQGGVVYICGEGAGGLKFRMRALGAHHGIPRSIPFWVLPRAVKFSDKQAVQELAAQVREVAGETPIRLVVIDTLARAMPGTDENSAGEVGSVIAACDWLKEELGCTVMPIAHTGKDVERGLRGSSAIDGAVDFELLASRKNDIPGEDIVTLTTRFQKDAEEAPPIVFDLRQVEVAPGKTSLVPVLRLGGQPKSDKLTPQQRAAFTVLEDLRSDSNAEAIEETAWRQTCVDGRRVSGSESPKTRREAFNTAFAGLVRAGRVMAEGGKVWLPISDEFPAAKAELAELGRNSASSATARPGDTAEEAESPVRTPPSAAPDAQLKITIPRARQASAPRPAEFDLAGWVPGRSKAEDARALRAMMQ